MTFLPTLTDYFMLWVFSFFFLLTGWLTHLLVCCEKKGRGDRYASRQESENVLHLSSSAALALEASFSRKTAPASGIETTVRQKRSVDRDLALLESILSILINGVVVTSIILLVTAQPGFFRFRSWCLLFVLYDVIVAICLKRSGILRFPWPESGNYKFQSSDWLVLPLCLLAVLTFNKPSKSIHTRDPGGYVNIAVRISETGSLRFKDPDFQQFHSEARQKLFLPVSLRDAPYPQVIPGFHLVDPVSGELTPRYFHLFPLWLALFFKLWRFSGMFALNVLLGSLSVLILVPLAQRLFGSRWVGLLSACLLALNMGQVWIVRSPFSEILTQVLLLAGVWALSIGMTEKRKGFCILGGILFGLTLFVRVDSVLILAALLMFAWMILVLSEKGRSVDFPLPSFLMALAVVVAYAALHTAVFAYPYLDTVINTFKHFSRSAKPSLLIGGLVTVLLLVLWKKTGLVPPFTRQQAFRTKFMVVLFTLVTAFFIYGYFIRPLSPSSDTFPLPVPLSGRVRYYDEITLVRLGWYVSPLGILLAYAGSLISLKRLVKDGSVVLLPFVLILVVFALFYLYKSRAFPDNYWVIRRYVEIVIPGFLLLSSLSLVSLLSRAGTSSPSFLPSLPPHPLPLSLNVGEGRRNLENNLENTPSPPSGERVAEGRVRGLGAVTNTRREPCRLTLLEQHAQFRRYASLSIGAGAFLLLAAWQLKASYPLLNQTEWENTFPQLENLAGANQEADVLLLERGQFQDFFSSPLKFIFHKTVYTFANNRPDVQAFETLMDVWTQQGKRVNLLASEEQTELPTRKYGFVPRERFRFHTKVVEQTYERIPQSMEDLRFTVQIYNVQKNLQVGDSTSITLNLGYHFGFKTAGFFNTELSNEYEPFRWSSGKSSIELPGLEGSQDAILFLRLRREAPENIALSPIRISLNGSFLGECEPSSRFEVMKYKIPGALLSRKANNRIEFFSSTFSPAGLGTSDDIRELAFMLHSVKLQSEAPIDANLPYFLDFGNETDAVDGELSGFYSKEPGSYRWTEPTAQVIISRTLAHGQALGISLRAVKSCPDPNFKQFLVLSVNGIDIGSKKLLDRWDDFRIYNFSIPRDVPKLPSTVITIRAVPPWIPKSADYYTDDWRALGCGIDWLKIEATRD